MKDTYLDIRKYIPSKQTVKRVAVGGLAALAITTATLPFTGCAHFTAPEYEFNHESGDGNGGDGGSGGGDGGGGHN